MRSWEQSHSQSQSKLTLNIKVVFSLNQAREWFSLVVTESAKSAELYKTMKKSAKKYKRLNDAKTNCKKMSKNSKIALKNAKESAKKNHKVPIEAKQVLKRGIFIPSVLLTHQEIQCLLVSGILNRWLGSKLASPWGFRNSKCFLEATMKTDLFNLHLFACTLEYFLDIANTSFEVFS